MSPHPLAMTSTPADWANAPVQNPELVRSTLMLGVPLARVAYADWEPSEIEAAVSRIDAHDLHADAALYGGHRAGQGMAGIIRSLALLSWIPGGVTFMGLHWCPNHAECEAA